MISDNHTAEAPYWDQDGVHEIYRSWRRVVDEYSGPERILCAEAWVKPLERLARYVREDEMHQAFNFAFLAAGWDGPALRRVVLEGRVDGGAHHIRAFALPPRPELVHPITFPTRKPHEQQPIQ